MSVYKKIESRNLKNVIEWHLREYHRNKAELEKIKNDMIPSAAASYAPREGSSGACAARTTENIAFKIMNTARVKFLEQSCEAVEFALAGADECGRKIVDLVYWKRTHTIGGAALSTNLSHTAAYNRINKILQEIAVRTGYVDMNS